MGKDSRFVEFTEVINRCRRNHSGSYACYDDEGGSGAPWNTYTTEDDCYLNGGIWTYSGVGDTHINYPGYPQTADKVVDINLITGYKLAYNCNKTVNTSNCIIELSKGGDFETNISVADLKTKLAKWFS